MKTEYYLAEFHLEDLKKYEKPDGRWHIINRTCHEHKFACQRFLEFFKRFKGLYAVDYEVRELIQNKITDLKQAIKHYEENGI